MINFSAFIFGSRPPRKIASKRKDEVKNHMKIPRTVMDSFFSTVCIECFHFPPLVWAMSLNKGWAVFWQRRVCSARLLTSERNARDGVKNHFTCFFECFIIVVAREGKMMFINFPSSRTHLIILRLLFGCIRFAIFESISFRYSWSLDDSISLILSTMDGSAIKPFTSCSNPLRAPPSSSSSLIILRFPIPGETRLCQRMLSM